jgi:protein-disulfide isomerase
MKPTTVLVGAMAVVAIAGCNSKQGDAATSAPVKLEQVKPPAGGDWSQVVNPSAAGGFVMGNPNAKVKLIEFGSMTCPHCREFDEEGVPALIETYVKSGQVSWEFRNYVRDGFDLAASLVARCNGAQSFFPLTRALYKDQQNWVAKIQELPQDQVEALQAPNQTPGQQYLAIGKAAGFPQWAAMRGVPEAKAQQCLSNENSINQLVQMNSDATTQFPDFQGTPSFAINGQFFKIEVGSATPWEQLRGGLNKALGERG